MKPLKIGDNTISTGEGISQQFPKSDEQHIGENAHHQFFRGHNESTDKASSCGASFYECAENTWRKVYGWEQVPSKVEWEREYLCVGLHIGYGGGCCQNLDKILTSWATFPFPLPSTFLWRRGNEKISPLMASVHVLDCINGMWLCCDELSIASMPLISRSCWPSLTTEKVRPPLVSSFLRHVSCV